MRKEIPSRSRSCGVLSIYYSYNVMYNYKSLSVNTIHQYEIISLFFNHHSFGFMLSLYYIIFENVSSALFGKSEFLPKSVISFHFATTSSAVIFSGSKKAPYLIHQLTSVRCHLNFAQKPPPISNTEPVSLFDSWQR